MALRFRLLRQHGYKMPQDVFRSFMDENGNFRESLEEDVEGILSLYEASFLGLKGEVIIDKAMEFSSMCLKKVILEKNKLPEKLVRKVEHALTMPIHWRCNRLQARWFIDEYEGDPDMNPALLKLAKLDFNILQSIYMKEVSKVTRWNDEIGLAKIRFSRTSEMEYYFFSNLMHFEPKYEVFRLINAKVCYMITFMDDCYDAYGSLEELELLTDFIDRWDIMGIDKLPHTIQTCFLTLYNTTNEIGRWALMEHGINIIPYLRKMWADQCKGYLFEANWARKALNLQTLNEYLNTAVYTIGGLTMIWWSFVATAETLTAESLASISNIPDIMLSSSLILRLVNDIATSLYGKNEGDNLKAVECYMNETGESEEAARDHMKGLILEAWKDMNEYLFDDHQRIALPRTFVHGCLDHARASQYFYQFGSGHGDNIRIGPKDDIISHFIRPIPMD